MKLYLSSVGIPDPVALAHLLGRPSMAGAKIIFTANGYDTYPPDRRSLRTEEGRALFSRLGVSAEEIDLRSLIGEPLKAKIQHSDLIWVLGGNTFYLRWIMRESGFDRLIQPLLEEGSIYGGESAGAAIASPSLAEIEPMDEPEQAPERIEEGLGLVDFILIPHWQSRQFAAEAKESAENAARSNYELVTLTDQQALVIDGGSRMIVTAS